MGQIVVIDSWGFIFFNVVFCGSLTFDLNFVALDNVLKINPTRIHSLNKKKNFN